MEAQIQEWRELGMVDENFRLEDIWDGGDLNPRYQYLPIDTKYFPDMEIQIIALFDNLDEALDGWLIKSENYQALRTILPKFRERVQTIYIDPPFNKEQDADYFYSVRYKDATWITLLENRLQLARDILKDTGSIFVRCDYNGNMYVRLLMNEIFGEENFKNEIILKRNISLAKTGGGRFEEEVDKLIFYSKSINHLFKQIYLEKEPEWIPMRYRPGVLKEKNYLVVASKIFYPPEGLRFPISQQKASELEKLGKLRESPTKPGTLEILYDVKILGTNWTGFPGYKTPPTFQTENSEISLKYVIESTSNEGDLVMDFFLGSGTTTAVAHKLKRKWIGVEVGEHFYTIVLPRMKRVLFYDRSGISKEKDVREQYNERNAGGFFKYYELEQYEDTLRRTRYLDDDLFTPPEWEDPCQYLFMRDPKMSEALEVDLEQGKVKVDLGKLYGNIDLPETLSNLTGKLIKRIYPDPDDPSKPACVEFTDGEKIEEIDLKNLDWRLIKPLIWW
jgi:adenine specific DNA methylase Mod